MKNSHAYMQAGFTLVELLIGVVLVSIAIVAVFQAVSEGSRLSRKDFLTRRAYQRLEQILEDPRLSYKGSYYVDGLTDNSELLYPGPHTLTDSEVVDLVLDERDTANPDDDLIGTAELEVIDIPPFDIQLGTVKYPERCCSGVRAKKLIARMIWYEDGKHDTASLETIVSLVGIN